MSLSKPSSSSGELTMRKFFAFWRRFSHSSSSTSLSLVFSGSTSAGISSKPVSIICPSTTSLSSAFASLTAGIVPLMTLVLSSPSRTTSSAALTLGRGSSPPSTLLPLRTMPDLSPGPFGSTSISAVSSSLSFVKNLVLYSFSPICSGFFSGCGSSFFLKNSEAGESPS